jgi:hypothetical protein
MQRYMFLRRPDMRHIRHPSPTPTHMVSQGHRASSAAPRRESPAPRALDRIQQILEGIEHATSASTLAIQSFVGQGELILVYLISLKFLRFSGFCFTL